MNSDLFIICVPLKCFSEALDPENLIQVFNAALCERQILFVSSQYSLLTYAAETIISLMYPFNWTHVYIPLLPLPLIGVVQAFMPFIVGVHSSFLENPEFQLLDETVVVLTT